MAGREEALQIPPKQPKARIVLVYPVNQDTRPTRSEPGRTTASLDRSLPERQGERIDDRYELLSSLGVGSQATVWRAKDIALEREVALKMLRRSTGGLTGPAGFRREAALLARLRSPHLATVFAYGMHGEVPYFAMELIEGVSLFELWQSHLRERVPMPLERTVDIVAAAARALSVAHARGIVHRDVKQENIMIEAETGRVVLVDFGVARDLHEGGEGGLFGTLEYLAPEVLDGHDSNAFSDQYALALVTYELLAGKHPFGPQPTSRSRARPPSPPPASLSRAELAPLDPVLSRALSTDPALRYPTSLAFGSALSEALVPSSRATSIVPVEETAALPSGALRVLVVEDDPVFSKLVARCLQVALAGIPLAISRTSDPQQALEKCRRRLPELVVLDYALPGMDGVELLGHIRALPGAERVRTIVVSASADERARHRFAMLGVRAFARKPIEFAALVETLHDVARANGWSGG